MQAEAGAREVLTVEEFLSVSAKINYQLSARSLKAPVLLSLVLGPAQCDEREQAILLQAFRTIQVGYDQDRRRLGTPGVLHPLRAAAVLARARRRAPRCTRCSPRSFTTKKKTSQKKSSAPSGTTACKPSSPRWARS
jgi:hypothetical protein